MQELVFNSTKRTVKLCFDFKSTILYQFDNVPTVRMIDGCYEVIQEENDKKYPVLRVPINNTNMIIEK